MRMRFYTKAPLTAWIVVMFLWLVVSNGSALVQDRKFQGYTLPPGAKGQLIVKYKDSVTECVHCVVKSKRSFEMITTDGSGSLDRLHSQYNVRAVRPIFRTEEEERKLIGGKTGSSLGILKRYQRDKIDMIKRKFVQRTKRISETAKVPELYHIYLLDFPEQTDIHAAAADFTQDPHVEYAQPNYFVETEFVPNDPFYQSSGSWGQPYEDLWGLKSHKLNLEAAWEITQGEGIVVGVIDSGLDYHHPDIAANVWTNTQEVPANGLDDDSNGFIDDGKGWDFAYDDNDPMDDNGHGTHVSGIVAAVGNNAIGIIGVAPQAKIIPIKALFKDGSGRISDLAEGVVYAAFNGADVINNSWGCGFCPINPIAEDAVRTAYGVGSVAVFAAGNSRTDVGIRSPQNMTDPKPVVVGATTQGDEPAFFTNFGALVDVGAPGGGTPDDVGTEDPIRNILSLKATDCDPRACKPSLIVQEKYLRQAGTSMAAPHIAGIAALLLASRPALTNEEVRQVLRGSADDVGQSGFDPQTGAGRPNAYKALTTESVLRVKITNPVSGSTFSQKSQAVSLSGIVAGSGIEHFQLFYRPLLKSTEWIPLSPSVGGPLEGHLSVWQMGTLQNGLYLLQLNATTSAGLQFQDVIEVALEQDRPRLVTTNPNAFPSDESGADISKNRIVWIDWRKKNGGLYFMDLSASIETLLHRGLSIYHTSISEDRIVLEGRAGIVVYDLATMRRRNISAYGLGPDISGDGIAWYTNQTPTAWDIIFCKFDPKSGTCLEQQITKNRDTQWHSAISGNLIVWEDLRNDKTNEDIGNQDIYLYDLLSKTERQITRHESTQFRPDVSGNRIVWMDSRNGNWDIYFCTYNSKTGKCPERRLTTDPSAQITPAISGDIIAWVDYRTGNPDIFVYDLTSKTERQITFQPNGQFFPKVSQNRVIWLDFRNAQYSPRGLQLDIYTSKIK